MNRVLVLLPTLFFCFALPAKDIAKEMGKVLSARGTVQYGGKTLKPGMALQGEGLLTTGEKSLVKVLLAAGKGLIILGPSSSYQLQEAPEPGKSPGFSHLQGTARMIFSKHFPAPPQFETKNASFGIRGTDFLLVFNPLLEESEIVVFDGEILFRSKLSDDEKVVPKGHWGGLGGRFTPKIGDLIQLPPHVLSAFDKQSMVDTDMKGAVEDADLYGQKIPR